MPDMRMYSDLAVWWPLLSPPADYAEEAADLLPSLLAAPDAAPVTVLELGSGGGSLASQLKAHFTLTLTDPSPAMLEVSRTVNPECEHVVGDMRTLELGRRFDLVLIHGAVMYMTTPEDVQAALATAARHCRPGGGIAVLPDCVTETFASDANTGGSDAADGRGLRYLEWSWDPDPTDTTFEVVYAFVMRRADGTVEATHEVHQNGLFPRAAWHTWLREAGFDVTSRIDPWDRDVFVGRHAPTATSPASSQA
jgi:SAM-dependent methyltransferase